MIITRASGVARMLLHVPCSSSSRVSLSARPRIGSSEDPLRRATRSGAPAPSRGGAAGAVQLAISVAEWWSGIQRWFATFETAVSPRMRPLPLWGRACRTDRKTRSGEGYASASAVCGERPLTQPSAWMGRRCPLPQGERVLYRAGACSSLLRLIALDLRPLSWSGPAHEHRPPPSPSLVAHLVTRWPVRFPDIQSLEAATRRRLFRLSCVAFPRQVS